MCCQKKRHLTYITYQVPSFMQVGITHCVYVFNMCELHNYVEIAHLAVFKFMTYRNNVYLGTIPIFKFSLIECKIKLYIPHLLILHTYCNQYEFRFVYRNKIVTPKTSKVVPLDTFFRQIKSFLRFHLAFVFGLQTYYLIDFSKIYGLKGLEPKNKG